MASIEKRRRAGRMRWYARYRTPDGKQCVKVFGRKLDAKRYLVSVESSKLTGAYIDPALSRLFVGDWARRWLDGQAHLKPSTLERYRGLVVADIEPKWKSVKLADVSHSDVQRWVSQLSKSRAPATVRKVYRVLSLILASAVMDGRLVRNPAAGVNLPRVVKAEQRYLTHDQVASLADACVTPRPSSRAAVDPSSAGARRSRQSAPSPQEVRKTLIKGRDRPTPSNGETAGQGHDRPDRRMSELRVSRTRLIGRLVRRLCPVPSATVRSRPLTCGNVELKIIGW
jgi:hypothetical protein